ncbi:MULTISPECIES: TrbC/VirB2 family protein [Novosphingobium]|uniref:TrbC/VirB2 family protein n=1 Tax=Novosphingobium TaxID=165696 RepID=UPI0022F26ABC|nr:TrbC/VirB2 family protein [Novosphingobium resinovorum]GLK45535.1 hypothetical protein GCM10017612_34550 [Novosphingobium resinovorum]
MFDNIGQRSEIAGGALVGAIGWIAEIMTGPLATIVATLAVATLGLALLQGRLSMRHGAQVILGCFILFGAPFIAMELVRVAPHGIRAQAVFSASNQQMPDIPAVPQPNPDPYAGASVPMQ